MAQIVPKPNELEFLIKLSKITDEDEKKKAEKEYDEQVKAYFA